ncbi:MAG: thioredoxin [Gammaproteobacteria bacterium]|nr:thioredoxin [Gammaproteobacteria bacterium]
MTESPYIFEATAQTFADEVLLRSRSVPVLVDFWADWCAPCRALMPVLQQLAGEYRGKFLLAKVNSDEQQDLATRYGVRSLPTVLVIRHGEAVDRFVGAQPEGVIRQLIDRHIERASDTLRAEARTLLDAGDTAQARELLETAHRTDPGNHGVTLDLAGLALRDGALVAALELLDGLPPEAQRSAEVQTLLARVFFLRELEGAPDTAELEVRIGTNPGGLDACYLLALRRIVDTAAEQGMEELLEIIRRDRKFRDDGARKALLMAFDLMSGQPELVSRFRRRLASALH